MNFNGSKRASGSNILEKIIGHVRTNGRNHNSFHLNNGAVINRAAFAGTRSASSSGACAFARLLTSALTGVFCRANSRITADPLKACSACHENHRNLLSACSHGPATSAAPRCKLRPSRLNERPVELHPLSRLGFDGQPLVHRNYDRGKRYSSIVRHLWEWATELVAAEHRCEYSHLSRSVLQPSLPSSEAAPCFIGSREKNPPPTPFRLVSFNQTLFTG